MDQNLQQVVQGTTELIVSQAEQLETSRALVNYVTESLAGVEKQVAALAAVQVAQVETQALILNDTIEFREFLTNFTSVVVSLQGPMEATSTIIGQMSAFINIGAAILQWGWLIPVLCIIHWFHPKYAQVAAVAIGTHSLGGYQMSAY